MVRARRLRPDVLAAAPVTPLRLAVEEAVAGAKAAGLPIARVDVDRNTGLISIITSGQEPESVDEIGAWLGRLPTCEQSQDLGCKNEGPRD